METAKPRYRIDAGHLLIHLVICVAAGMAVRPLLGEFGLLEGLTSVRGSRGDLVSVLGIFVTIAASRLLNRLVSLGKPIQQAEAPADK